MKPTAPLTLALCLLLPLSTFSQQAASSPGTQPFTDPANLRGERVSPLTGHELPIDQGTLGLAELLRKLNTRASILNIVAHPDDEDGGMLTLYARGFGARVTDLALTRGEGGQNFVTGDFEDALGLIRTQELLANDRYTGVSQLFGTEVDFGFSKTKEEAFAKWTHDRVLYDAVRAIRLVRPLVITATFIGNVTDGHGQHQVSGEIAQEAFKAAADPNVFPDQIAQGLLPWQALKIYARVPFAEVNEKGVYDYATGQYVPARFTNYVTGKVTTTKPAADVTVPEGATDPLLTVAAANPSDIPSTLAAKPDTQLSYIQFGRIGLSLQRSQISKNMTLPVAGFFNSGYTLYGSVLCNAPATARPASLTPKTCHPDQAPTARPITAQGEALGTPHENDASAESAIQNPIDNQALQASRDNQALLGSRDNPALLGSRDNPALLGSRDNQALLGSRDNPALLGSRDNPALLGSRDNQVPRGFSLGSHGPSPESGFSPQGVPSPSAPEAPTARPITAQGEALGTPHENDASAESAIQNPTLTTQPNFFTGIDTSIIGLQDIAPGAFPTDLIYDISRAIKASIEKFDPAHPDSIAPLLAEALQDDDTIITTVEAWKGNPIQKANALHELRIKRVQLNNALALALGLRFDATNPTPTGPEIPEKTHVSVETSLSVLTPVSAQLHEESLQLEPPAKAENGLYQSPITYGDTFLRQGTEQAAKLDLAPEFVITITQPYFYRDNIEQPVYKLRDTSLRNAPQTPAAITAWAELTYEGADITIGRIVHNGPQPISIIPPVSIASAPTATVLPTNQTTANLTATLRTDATTSANINVQSPHNWSIEAKAAGPNSVNFLLHPTAPITGPQTFHVTAQTPDHHTYSEGYRAVGYPGLILTNYYTPATTRVVPVDLKLPAHVRIAYLPGTGDAVPEALASIGLAPTMITVADLTPTKLASFDTVILGVRAYTANPDLHGAPSQALIDFARNGGNVLVQYETNGLTPADAPYPLSLSGGEKVVDETAPVALLGPATNGYPEPSGSGPKATEKEGVLTPAYALLNVPNKITPADFNNWVAERGHGFLTTWDDHYTPLTETHDPGGAVTPAQLPQRGGLVTAQIGKGRWTYCAFALYRQLPEAVPGAFRLFVNLLAPAHN